MSSAFTPSRAPGNSSAGRLRRRDWIKVLRRTLREFSRHRILSLAAGVTYYALLAIFPAIGALVSVYGLFADPASISGELASLSMVLPGGAIEIIGDQIKALMAQHHATLSLTFFGGLVLSLWSASSGIKAMFDAMNVIYDEDEDRGFIKLAGIALLFTFGFLAFLILAFAAAVAVPVVLNFLALAGPLGWTVSVLRWPLILLVVNVGLTITYRFGPSRMAAEWQWVSWGSAFASIAWLVVSGAFSWYAANFGRFNATYGSLGAVIGFMMWLWLSFAIVLLGAQLNAEIARRSADDVVPAP